MQTPPLAGVVATSGAQPQPGEGEGVGASPSGMTPYENLENANAMQPVYPQDQKSQGGSEGKPQRKKKLRKKRSSKGA